MEYYGAHLLYEHLAHHGILGQKWGKRNGPPYPLGKADHSASEKKAGWTKSLDNSKVQDDNKSNSKESTDKKEKKGLTDKQKKAIAIGAITVTALAATFGAYKLGAFDKLVPKGERLVGSILESDFGDSKVSNFSNSQNTFKKLSIKETVSDVISKVNPTGSHSNCYNVVVATTGRLCGLDVFAKGDTHEGKGISFDEVCRVFKLNPDNDKDVIRINNPSVESIARQITKRYSEGDVGAISLDWNDSYKKPRGASSDGHTLNWTIQNGKVEFLDGQARRYGKWLKTFISDNMDSSKEVQVAKFGNTNKEIDLENDVDTELLKKFVF